MKKFLVTVQRPTFESIQLTVEADDEAYATEKSLVLAPNTPAMLWSSDDTYHEKADYKAIIVEELK